MQGKLLKYQSPMFQALSSTDYTMELTLEVGILFKRKKVVKYPIPYHENIQLYFDYWDELIKTGEKISLR